MNTTHKGEFGRFVAEGRRRENMTQRELAARVHVTESAVSKWERGLSYPDIATLSALARTLRVTEGELLTASEDREGRSNAKQARVHRRWRGALLWSTLGLQITAIITAFIVNLAVQHTLSWFWVVLAAVTLMSSVTTLPLLLRVRRRGWVTLAVAVASLVALLAVIEILYGGGFFLISASSVVFAVVVIWSPLAVRGFGSPRLRRHTAVVSLAIDTIAFGLYLSALMAAVGRPAEAVTIALPLAALAATTTWLVTLAIRYLPLRGLKRAAAGVMLFGVAVFVTPALVDVVLTRRPFLLPPVDLTRWDTTLINGNVAILTAATAIVTALALFVVPPRRSAVQNTAELPAL